MHLLLALLLAGAAHPDSHSFSAVRVEGAEVAVELHVQSRSVIEALGYDVDLDGRLSAPELEAARPAVAAYLLEHYRVSVGSDGRPGAGRPLAGEVVALVTHWRADALLPEEWLQADLRFDAGAAPDELLIEVDLFATENPFHRDTCVLEWNDEPQVSWLFGIDGPAWWVESAGRRRPRVLAEFLGRGLRYPFDAVDLAALLLVLLVVARSGRGLAGVAAAFAAAELLALGLGAYQLVEPPQRLVALVAAMSVAYVAAENLLFRAPSPRVPEAFVFGLVHGLAAAAFLAPSLRSEPLLGTGVAGFALGLVLAEGGAALALAFALSLLPGDRAHGDRPRAWLAPRAVRLGTSSLVLVFGGWWFVQRAGWLG